MTIDNHCDFPLLDHPQCVYNSCWWHSLWSSPIARNTPMLHGPAMSLHTCSRTAIWGRHVFRSPFNMFAPRLSEFHAAKIPIKSCIQYYSMYINVQCNPVQHQAIIPIHDVDMSNSRRVSRETEMSMAFFRTTVEPQQSWFVGQLSAADAADGSSALHGHLWTRAAKKDWGDQTAGHTGGQEMLRIQKKSPGHPVFHRQGVAQFLLRSDSVLAIWYYIVQCSKCVENHSVKRWVLGHSSKLNCQSGANLLKKAPWRLHTCKKGGLRSTRII